MATTSVPASAKEATTRLEKGWAIYSEHASEIIASYNRGVWLVPSQSDGTSVYEVRLGRRGASCECLDHTYRPGARCKHRIAVQYASANSEHCAVCGRRVLYSALEPVEGDSSLGLACRGCS